MVDSQSQKISLGEKIKDSEMLSQVPDHLKTKKICKHAVKINGFNKVCSWPK